ncbi:M35 family metallo-endopeptidase [Myxococcaceae bacterium GXIMD 01537]
MSKSNFKWLVGALVGVSLLGGCGAPAEGEQAPVQNDTQATGNVRATVTVAKAALAASEDVAVTVTLTNVSSHPVRLLKWYTPGEGLKEGLLSVSVNGEPVEYIGPHLKRVAPRVEDYVTLAPGESLSGRVPVSGMYDLSETGTYSIRYDVGELPLYEGVGAVSQFESSDVTLWLEGRASGHPMVAAQGTVSAQSLSYSGACTSSEQSSISSAFSSATTYANNSYNYLNTTTPSGTARYTTWFGAYTSTRWNTAKSHFLAIKNAFATAAVVVDCSCSESGTYAYVYPASPYKIYVCGAFWSAPTTGTDSKAGTLVHEMSHFNVVAGTDDHAYGQTAAKSLAKSSPTKALDNADSHEYFAENTPAQQ